MKLTPSQLGVLASYVKDSLAHHPVSALTHPKRYMGTESTQAWEKRLAELIDECPAWSFDYRQLCETESGLLDFLIEYYSDDSSKNRQSST